MSSKLYPMIISRNYSDWYRNMAAQGCNNSHLSIGFEMRWALGVYGEIRSFDAGTYVSIFNLVIL